MVILNAKEGMVYFNGETYGQTISLPDNFDISVWEEITLEEAERRLNELTASTEGLMV